MLQNNSNPCAHFKFKPQFLITSYTTYTYYIGDKTGKRYDALSLFVVEYHPASNAKTTSANVEIVTMGHRGYKKNHIKKVADYSTRLWPGHNPNFLLSGQLSGRVCLIWSYLNP